MTDSVNFSKQTISENSLLKTNTGMSNMFSSLTHPSVQSRNTDDLFKRIRSGNDVLCTLPSRLDPNIQFSDDEEDEENLEEQINKTPKLEKQLFSPRSLQMPRNKLILDAPSTQEHNKNHTPPFGRQHQSASKLSFVDSSGKNIVPRNANRAKPKEGLSERKEIPQVKMNLMSMPEFKASNIVPTKVSGPSDFDAKPKKNSSFPEKNIVVNGKYYTVLSLLGTGGSCKVYSVYDLERKSLVAVKCVDLINTDPVIREGYKKEIQYLKKLRNSNRVIQMFDFQYMENELFIVLEKGDIDFSKYLTNEVKKGHLSPLKIKFYWAQMLEAVSDIHKYGIVHSDLKPANFLLVAGDLKLIDFGIAAAVPDDKTSAIRDTYIGTLNYMSPEAVTQYNSPGSEQVCFKVGVKSDVWSLGCILYNMVYGETPFQHIKVMVQKLTAIINPEHKIVFKSIPDKLLLDVMQLCLRRNPKERATVDELLQHPYLTENKGVCSSPEAAQSGDLQNIMKQMEILTPRRMSYLSKVVKELSQKQEEC